MKTIEPMIGKSLSEGSDILARQIRYVADTVKALSEWERGRDDADQLRRFLADLRAIRDNVRVLLATAEVRVGALDRTLSVRLADVERRSFRN